MRFAWAALAAVLLGAGAAAQPAPQRTPAEAASLVADAMQGQLSEGPLSSEMNGTIIRRIHAEGDLLIFTVEFPPDATESNHVEYVSGFISGACETQPNPLFDSGVRVRVDTYARGGERRQSEIITRCPAAPAT